MTGFDIFDMKSYLHPDPNPEDTSYGAFLAMRRKKLLLRQSKTALVNTIFSYEDGARSRDATITRLQSELRAAQDQLAASKASLAELEKVQQEMVARLERAYEAIVKATLR